MSLDFELGGRLKKWHAKETNHPHEMLVLTALAFHLNKDGWCWPSMKTLCDFTHLGRTSINKAVRGLEKKQLIRVKRTPGNNRYYIRWWDEVKTARKIEGRKVVRISDVREAKACSRDEHG